MIKVNLYGIIWGNPKDPLFSSPVAIQGFYIKYNNESGSQLFDLVKKSLEDFYGEEVEDICEIIIKGN